MIFGTKPSDFRVTVWCEHCGRSNRLANRKIEGQRVELVCIGCEVSISAICSALTPRLARNA